MKGAWLFLITTSCATPGRTWVHDAGAPQRPAPSGPSARALTAADEDAPSAAPVRRPVITLGERTEPQEDAPPSAASAPSAPVTIVQVNVSSAYPAYGYGGYYGSGWGGARPPEPPDHQPRPDPSPTPPMAGNWSAPPSYGPPVMSHTLPADPWH